MVAATLPIVQTLSQVALLVMRGDICGCPRTSAFDPHRHLGAKSGGKSEISQVFLQGYARHLRTRADDETLVTLSTTSLKDGSHLRKINYLTRLV